MRKIPHLIFKTFPVPFRFSTSTTAISKKSTSNKSVVIDQTWQEPTCFKYKIPIFTLETRLAEQENSIWSLQTRKTRLGSRLLLYWSENLEGCGSKKWQKAVKVFLFISRGFEVKSWELIIFSSLHR